MSDTDTITDDEARAKVTELIRDARICMLTSMTSDGRHLSRPMGLQEAEFDGDLWFIIDEHSDKAGEIRENPEVNISFSDTRRSSWVSISGRGEIVHDQARIADYWHPFLEAWFPDGPDTPGIALLKVHASSAEYWDTPGGRIVTLFQIARAAVTHNPDVVGDNRAVDLS